MEASDKNSTVMGISLDKIKEELFKTIKYYISTQVFGPKGGYNGAAKLFNIQSTSQNFLINPEGRISAKNLQRMILSYRDLVNSQVTIKEIFTTFLSGILWSI